LASFRGILSPGIFAGFKLQVRVDRIAKEEMHMKRLDLVFLLSASASLLVGVSLGISMGIRQDFALAPVHAHLNLLGWASLALFGLTYRAYPELNQRRLAKVHALLAVPAAVLLPAGIGLAIFEHDERLVIAASLAWLAGCMTFFVQLVRLAFGLRSATPNSVQDCAATAAIG
jgi:hypothetical protein